MPSISTFIDAILPEWCPGCGRRPRADGPLCAACLAGLWALPLWFEPPPPLASAWCLGSYAGPVGALVRKAKYGPDPWAMALLCERLGAAADCRLPRVDVVTHVPVHRSRLGRRGFDQAAQLARGTAAAIGRPHQALLRRRSLGEQAGRSGWERRHAAHSAFTAGPGRLQGARVLLVDDVLTTGSTASACAQELLAAGALRVHLLVAAWRQPRPIQTPSQLLDVV